MHLAYTYIFRTKKLVIVAYDDNSENPLSIAQVLDLEAFSLDCDFDSLGRLWVNLSPQENTNAPHVAVFDWTGKEVSKPIPMLS